MKGSYLQIILIFAIFLLPEIIKIFKKKNAKKYEYPDEQKNTSNGDYAKQRNRQQTPQNPPDLWDILTGRANYRQPEPEYLAVEEEVVATPRAKPPESQAAVVLQGARRPVVKITAKNAANGLIMAEILGKPRALRPMERELPFRREYR